MSPESNKSAVDTHRDRYSSC